MLRAGKTTPEFVVSMLSVFGENPHGGPNYRLIWSDRKMIYFAGEMCPEYIHLGEQRWILEAWTAPEKDGGTPEQWERTTFGLLGPYPAQGTYNIVEDSLRMLPLGWEPTEEAVRLMCVALVRSRDLTMKQRAQGIREHKEAEAEAARKETADAIVELQDSASRGMIQQPAAGKKNNFRTVDDYERDLERSVSVKNLPNKGGKIY
jgi:hypothetical protein